MYQEILEKNLSFIKNQKSYRRFNETIASSVNTLNSKNIITISGLRHTGKTKLTSEILKKTKSFESSFYYNSELDSLWVIKNKQDLITLLDIYVRVYGVPKIIVLQNTNNIEGIKDFISQLFKTKKYKLIIVGNNIKIEGTEDIELFPLGIDTKNPVNNNFWGIPEVRIVPDTHYKNFLLEALKHDIISRDILEAYNIKNISLFYQVMSYIAQNPHYLSMREMHRNLCEHQIDISLLTMIDYVTAAINTKFLSRCYLYDVKHKNTITSKAQYFFWDVWIRKSFEESLDFTENLLYIELLRNWYEVSGGLSGRFQFAFRANKDGKALSIALDTTWDKNEIRKTARKLAKLWDSSKKFVIVQNKNSLNMRKFVEEWVKIIEIEEFVKEFIVV